MQAYLTKISRVALIFNSRADTLELMLRGTHNLKFAILLLGDSAAAYLSLAAALFLRYKGSTMPEHWRDHAAAFTVVFFLWFVIFYIVGLYEFRGLRGRIELISRTSEGLGASFFISLAVFYLVPFFRIAPKTNLVITMGIFAVFFLGWRLLTMHLFSRHKFRLSLLFLGTAPEVHELKRSVSSNPHLGYNVLGQFEALPTSGNLPDSDVIVVSHLLPENDDMTKVLYNRFFAATTVIDLPNFYEEIHRMAPESAMNKQWVLGNIARRDVSLYEFVKRPLDIALALALAVPTIILTPFIALAIRLEDFGPIFYLQIRVGKNGRLFTMLKFRTMRTDAEKDGAVFAELSDDRVTRVGRLLRATRLDELPQIWNIILGDMSFVGPRPERPEMESSLTEVIPLFPVRRLARPGLTGWAQIKVPYASSTEDHRKKLRHDLYYLKHQSLALDTAIILQTIYSVIKRKGR